MVGCAGNLHLQYLQLVRVYLEHLVHLNCWYWPLTLCHRRVFEIHFPVNGGLVISSCRSILELKLTPNRPVPVSTNAVFQELLCQYCTELNLWVGITTVLKVCLRIVRIHFWDGKVSSKAMTRPIFGSSSLLNGDECMPPVVVVINLMSIQKKYFQSPPCTWTSLSS